MSIKNYIKYYSLEGYLFEEVSQNFKRCEQLTDDEFFAIVIWKRNASKTKIKDSLIKCKKDVGEVTREISENRRDPDKQLDLLTGKTGIKQVGISIASAILTVCYPSEFTVVDYRAFNSLIELLREEKFADIKGKYSLLTKYIEKYLQRERDDINDITKTVYLEYLKACKELAERLGFPLLRDFDRMLWGMDFYSGKGGLKALVEKYQRKELEPKRIKSVENSVGEKRKSIYK